MELPKFEGGNLMGWFCRGHQFSSLTAPFRKPKSSALYIHLEDKALQWHQMFMKDRVKTAMNMKWEEYEATMVKQDL